MITDPLSTITTLLSGNWNADNTDSVTPTFKNRFDGKRTDAAEGDFILVYSTSTLPERNSIGATTRRRLENVSVDIRTMYGGNDFASTRTHFIKLIKEVDRILGANILERTPIG